MQQKTLEVDEQNQTVNFFTSPQFSESYQTFELAMRVSISAVLRTK